MKIGDLVYLVNSVSDSYFDVSARAKIVDIKRCSVLLRPQYLLQFEDTEVLKWFDSWHSDSNGYELVLVKNF